jgi:hypothetical protein
MTNLQVEAQLESLPASRCGSPKALATADWAGTGSSTPMCWTDRDLVQEAVLVHEAVTDVTWARLTRTTER